MNRLDTLLSANKGDLMCELAKNAALKESDARNAVIQMVPAVALRLSPQRTTAWRPRVAAR
jgi:hypothetical protein